MSRLGWLTTWLCRAAQVEDASVRAFLELELKLRHEQQQQQQEQERDASHVESKRDRS